MNLPQLSPAWRRALPVFLLVLLAVFLLYGRTGLAMVEIWDRSGTFAHAFVVPPIALWLIWRRKDELAQCQPRVMPLMLLPLGLLAFIWLLGDLVAVNSVTQLAFTAMLVLTVPLCLGPVVTRLIAFPLLFLFFSVPIGEFMMPTMMEWTADFTVMALQASGVPVYREGLSFVIPSGSWSVVEACSGIRYLIASVMVGTLFAYLNYRSLRKRLIFIGVATLLPILANWLRAYMIVMLGHLSNNAIATGVDHIIYGWVFFGVVMLVLFLVGMRWVDPEMPPVILKPEAVPATNRYRLFVAVAALALLAVPTVAVLRMGMGAPAEVQLSDGPELSSKGWQREPVVSGEFKPHFENPRAELQRSYRRKSNESSAELSGAAVGVYLAYYRHQDYDSKLVSSNNVLAQPSSKEWRITAADRSVLDIGDRTLPLRTAELRSVSLRDATSATRLHAFEVYWINGHWTDSDLLAKIYGAWGRLSGRGDDAAVLVIYAEPSARAEEQMKAFLRDNLVLFEGWLTSVKTTVDTSAQRQSTP